MTLESALIPIPSEITMPFSGFLVAKGSLSFVPVVLAGAIGNLVGSLIAYYIGYFLEENIIVKNIRKYGKFILVNEHDLDRANRWFKKYGDSILFLSRLLPGVRTFISLPAGIFGMNIWKFSSYTLAGSIIWSIFLTYIGFYFQSRWNVLEQYFRKFDFIIMGIIVFFILIYLNHKMEIIKLRKK